MAELEKRGDQLYLCIFNSRTGEHRFPARQRDDLRVQCTCLHGESDGPDWKGYGHRITEPILDVDRLVRERVEIGSRFVRDV